MKCSNHLSLATVALAPSAEWSVECPGWCIVRVNEGQGYWLGDNGAQAWNAGQVAVLSPMREGSFRASQLGPVTLSYFRFSPELVAGVLTPPEKDRLEALAAQPSRALRCFAAETPGAELFGRLQDPAATVSGLMLRAELLRIVAFLFAEELASPSPAVAAVLSARQKLKLLVNQMPEAEFLRLTAREMAERCGGSVTHVNRSFRKLFGLSLAKKQELIRLQRARQSLVESNSRIETVALDAGYRDVKTFSAAFKKQFGVSPGEWRHPRTRSDKTRENGENARTRGAHP